MSRSGRDSARRKRRRIQDATRKLERAVEELASAATDEVSDRAASLLDAAAARVRGESGSHRHETGSDRHDTEGEARRSDRASKRAHYRDFEDLSRRSRGLSLDRENRKIVGVCAGIARYLGIEAWLARCVALTGLIFMPSIVFPAYWVAFFVMGHSSSDRRARPTRARGRAERRGGARRRRRRYRRTDRGHRASASAAHARPSPRQSLRAAQADFAEVELRLRRIEAFVTSDRYDLERGFAEISANATATSRSATGRQEEQ